MAGSEGKDYGASVVRTVTLPLIVALVVNFILKVSGTDLGEWEPVLVAVFGYAGYAIVRFLEVFVSPKWGYVLGLAKYPSYNGK